MRKLASIRVINEISEIPNSDKIEVATVDGWKVVVAKDVGHKVGDTVIYCEIDSFLPIREEFEFLRKSSYKKMGDKEGFRLKTIKLRGQVSQGLILPLDVLLRSGVSADDVYEGLDVTTNLDIQKYEPPIPAQLSGKVKGVFPSFIPKTDEERIQNHTDNYNNWLTQSHHQFYVTEKLDGSSSTFYHNNGEFGVCSRNLELSETEDNSFWKVARKLDLENKMKSLGMNIALQGELIGEGIQGNPYKIKGQTVKFYTGFDIETYNRIPLNQFQSLLNDLGLSMVPLLESPFNLPNTISEMVEYADGKSVLNEQTNREGVVVRSMDGTISFKSISNIFLLGEK
jgi:RNA ligase (TIGR02306 family)